MSSFLKSSKSISARLASMVIGSWEVNQLYSMLPLQSSSPGECEHQNSHETGDNEKHKDGDMLGR